MSDVMVEELKGKLEKAFQENIAEGETVDVKLQLHAGEGIAVTNKGVMIIKAGMVSAAGFFGASCKTFYYNQITSVDLRLGVMGGHIQLTVAGSTDIKGKGFLDMGKAENAATFTMDYKDRMKKVAELIRERVQLSQTQGTTPQQTKSVAEQIKELADLKQQGILSEEEFDQAKKKLLNN